MMMIRLSSLDCYKEPAWQPSPSADGLPCSSEWDFRDATSVQRARVDTANPALQFQSLTNCVWIEESCDPAVREPPQRKSLQEEGGERELSVGKLTAVIRNSKEQEEAQYHSFRGRLQEEKGTQFCVGKKRQFLCQSEEREDNSNQEESHGLDYRNQHQEEKKKEPCASKNSQFLCQAEERGFNCNQEDIHGLDCRNQRQMQQTTNDPYTLVALLKACAKKKDLHTGSRIHADIVKMGLLEDNIFLGSILVSMYTRCGSLAKAQELFDELPVRNVVSWNALITGYAHHGHGEQALKCFEQMVAEGFSPDAITFVSLLKACGSIGAADKGKELHEEIVKAGLLETNIIIANTLVGMYVKCGLLAKAQEVFDGLPARDRVSWNALIAGYAQHEYSQKVLKFVELMQLEGFSPDAVTFVCALKACGSIGDPEKGRRIHNEIIRDGLLKENVLVGNALVDMYAKCGLLAKAQEVFNELSVRDVVSWNALMAGYAQHGHGEQTIKCYAQMQLEGLSPDAVTFVCMLKACGSIGAADKGHEIHTKAVRQGLLNKSAIIGTAVVDMYAKCGKLAKAQEVFDKLPLRNVITWNVLMTGYALLGEAEQVFSLFDEMIGEGIKPNLSTFAIVLNVCNHNGLLDKGQMYFQSMSTDYGVMPALEHHTCMIDLFARAGHLDKAVTAIKEMPFPADVTLWLTVLGACQRYRNMELARVAFEHAVQLDEKEAASYVCMGNVFATAEKQVDADKVEAMGGKNRALKNPGDQSTDITGSAYFLCSKDKDIRSGTKFTYS